MASAGDWGCTEMRKLVADPRLRVGPRLPRRGRNARTPWVKWSVRTLTPGPNFNEHLNEHVAYAIRNDEDVQTAFGQAVNAEVARQKSAAQEHRVAKMLQTKAKQARKRADEMQEKAAAAQGKIARTE